MFSRFFAKKICLGVDIGTSSVKMAALQADKNNQPQILDYAILETYGYLERANAALQTSTLKIFEEEIVGYLRLMIRKMKLPAGSLETVASLPTFSAFTTLIEVPPEMPEAELVKTMNFKAKQYLPLPFSSVVLDWTRVGAGEVFLIAVPNEQVERFEYIFKESRLKLVALEIEGLALARSLTTEKQEPTLIIDIGSSSTVILLVQKGRLYMANQLDFAGGSLTQALSSSLEISSRRAEDLKKQKGLIGLEGGPERELSTILLPILDVIINEARRVKANRDFSRVIICGGGAKLLGLSRYLDNELGLPVELANPFARIGSAPALEPLLRDLGPNLAVAAGLALRNFF